MFIGDVGNKIISQTVKSDKFPSKCVENAQTLETTMIKNSMRYLHKFICALPNKKYFLVNDRSLFLSR